MAATERSQTDQVEDLQTAHPDWKLWRSAKGSWMANRKDTLPPEQLWPSFANTLMEATAEGLAEKLAEQKRLAGSPAPEDDPRRLAIWQLAQTLNAHQLDAVVAESEPVLVVAGNPKDGTRALTVRCELRPADDGRLWFWVDPDSGRSRDHAAKPLIEADRLADAMVHICGERQIRDRRE